MRDSYPVTFFTTKARGDRAKFVITIAHLRSAKEASR